MYTLGSEPDLQERSLKADKNTRRHTANRVCTMLGTKDDESRRSNRYTVMSSVTPCVWTIQQTVQKQCDMGMRGERMATWQFQNTFWNCSLAEVTEQYQRIR